MANRTVKTAAALVLLLAGVVTTVALDWRDIAYEREVFTLVTVDRRGHNLTEGTPKRIFVYFEKQAWFLPGPYYYVPAQQCPSCALQFHGSCSNGKYVYPFTTYDGVYWFASSSNSGVTDNSDRALTKNRFWCTCDH